MPDQSTEYTFNLLSQNVSLKKSDGSALGFNEASRRSNIGDLRAFARLYINDRKVSETKK